MNENKDYTTIDFDSVIGMIGSWQSALSSYVGSYKMAAEDSTFKVLETLGLTGGFPQRFDSKLEEYASNISSLINALDQYVVELKTAEEELEKDLEKHKRKHERDHDGAGGAGGAVVTPKVDNIEDQLAFFKDISMSDLVEILATLNTLAMDNEISIDELLSNEKFGAKIKELLLNNVKISELYRVMIDEGSTISLMTALKSLLNGEIPEAIGFDEITSLTLKSYLMSMADKNNIQYSDLISNESYSNELKKYLNDMKEVEKTLSQTTEENAQQKLLDIYNGNIENADEASINVIRSQVDTMSSLTNIPYEDLLTNKEYGRPIYTSVGNLQKASVFCETLSNVSNPGSIISNLIK